MKTISLAELLRGSFRMKAFLKFTVFVIAISSSFTALFVLQQTRFLTSALIKRGTLATRSFAYGSRIGVFSESGELLEGALQGLLQDRDVLSGSIYAYDGRLLRRQARHGPAAGGDPHAISGIIAELRKSGEPLTVERSETIDFWSPVVSGTGYKTDESLFLARPSGSREGRLIGFVNITMDKRELHEEVKALLKRGVSVGAVFLMLGLAVVYFITKRITTPLNRLTECVAAFGTAGRTDEVAVESCDEIGKLAKAFNVMVGERKRLEGELKRYSGELELRVRERTAELFAAKQDAEAASRIKSDFLANMSHELRTPLNSIIGFSEIMLYGAAGPVADRQREYLQDIHESGKSLLTLISDILDLSKIEAGRQELEISEFSLSDAIEASLAMFREKALKENVALRKCVCDEVRSISADARKIRQVLFNLIGNALKFTPHGGQVLVEAGPAAGGRPYVEISVLDTGVGISAGDMEKLFRPFHQLDAILTKKSGGAGVGLYLCKKLVELHDGRIWGESEPGKGSRFTFEIPLLEVAAARRSGAGEEKKP